MLNEDRLRKLLPVSGLGEPLYFYTEVGSTNDVAISLANKGKPSGTLIIAEGQTAGRGQRGRKWITVPGSGLAMSLILRPTHFTDADWMKYHALGALAVVEVLEMYGLEAQIKWPNDVLLHRKKVAGTLVEVSWEGERVEFIVLGVGVNVSQDPVLDQPDFELPTISVEEALQESIDWHELLKRLLSCVSTWYSKIHRRQIIEEWEKKLAYRGEEVVVSMRDEKRIGRVVGLNENGALRILTNEDLFEVHHGDVKVRLFKESE
jgi:BirA family biotin operon repressor/biotin-[acetyl-CoA-carboxylase] ligase